MRAAFSQASFTVEWSFSCGVKISLWDSRQKASCMSHALPLAYGSPEGLRGSSPRQVNFPQGRNMEKPNCFALTERTSKKTVLCPRISLSSPSATGTKSTREPMCRVSFSRISIMTMERMISRSSWWAQTVSVPL